MAKSQFREHLQGDAVRLKKYFYVLRPLLAARWIERYQTPAPIEFGQLLPMLDGDAALLAAIDDLLAQKRAAPESGTAKPHALLHDFIAAELERLEQLDLHYAPPAVPQEHLSGLFQSVLGEAASAPNEGDLQAVLAFIYEVDKLKAVERKSRPLGLARQENSAEHSWHIALLALSLAPFAEPGTDIARVVSMLLLHDLGEIDTGDTMLFAKTDAAAHHSAELAAMTRIVGLLPAPQAAHYLALWQEFEAGTSREARFAHAADRAMPVLLNLANNGQSWKENGISHAQVVAKAGPPIAAGCKVLWDDLLQKLEAARAAGWFST
jgi:putative hydrolases of HD superfamily